MTAQNIRPATDVDVNAVRDLFVLTYGDDYPFKQFYDTSWLKKAVFDDDTAFLVIEADSRILGTISATCSAGSLSDLVCEFGRLVVHPDARGKDLGTHLFEAAADQVSPMIRFGFAEGRTAHPGSQKILERTGFTPLGFEPLKYRLLDRESMVLYGRLFGDPADLRRNNPRLIPEIAPLAMNVLADMGLPQDVIVTEETDGYPAGAVPEIEDLSEQGWSPLLRIERGRVTGREVFGNLSLSHGFFKIRAESTRYLVARDDDAVLGGLGFTHDPIDDKVRIFELIGFDDAVKGALLRETERIAREELNALYIEADVSAYSPAIQRTLERMGFMAVAYCPSMVFEEVERLDVVRMAKLTAPYFREDIPLTEDAARLRDTVETSMADRREGRQVAEAAKHTQLFGSLEEGDMNRLARIGRARSVPAGQTLVRQGDPPDNLFVVISGTMKVLVDGRQTASLGPGNTAGEMALLDLGPRSANVIAIEDCLVAELRCDELRRTMDERPRLGLGVLQSLAADLAGKLRRMDTPAQPPTGEGA